MMQGKANYRRKPTIRRRLLQTTIRRRLLQMRIRRLPAADDTETKRWEQSMLDSSTVEEHDGGVGVAGQENGDDDNGGDKSG